MELGDFERFAAADVGAGELVVASYHVRLRFGKAGTVTLVGAAGKLGTFTAYDPADLVFAWLTALGAGEGMGSQFGCFVKKVPLFHLSPRAVFFPFGSIYSILIFGVRKRKTVKKRKPGTFSATKAVKANARERVGQPKPARVLSTEPRTGRAAKHKPRLEELMKNEE